MSEDLKLLPCPACGTPPIMTGGASWHEQQEFWIKCKNKECGCCRVGDTVRENCLERWNSLPRALTWTTEPPKVEGDYWWKCEQESSGEAHIVNITMYPDGAKYSHHFHYGSGPCFHECDLCQYAGPIPAPKETTS